jgi:hypothetical protein
MLRGFGNLRLFALTLALANIPVASADMLYRWTDGQGQPHISDHPPPGDVGPTEQFHAPSYAAPDLPAADDPYSILNQAKRLEESRLRLTRERQEKQQRDREYELRRRELEARAAAQAAPASPPVYAYRRPIYPRPPTHRPPRPDKPGRPWTLWEPEHPAYRPYPRPPSGPPRAAGSVGAVFPRP